MSAIRLTWFKKENQRKQGWDNQELAEFYRIIDILDKANMAVEVDQGLSDEGDPWFVFVRAETGDVVAHFARVDGKFISIAAASILAKTYHDSLMKEIDQKYPCYNWKNNKGYPTKQHRNSMDLGNTDVCMCRYWL